MAVCEDTLIAVLPSGVLKELPKKEYIYNQTKRARRDEKIFPDKAIDSIKAIWPFSQSADKIVISREGTAWHLLAEVGAEEFLQANEWEECRGALAAGGIFVDLWSAEWRCGAFAGGKTMCMARSETACAHRSGTVGSSLLL